MAFTVEHALNLLETARKTGRLPHALLLAGTASAGTHRLALALAKGLNGCRAETLESLRHPMCRMVRPGSKSRRILIEDIRSIEPFLQLKAEPGDTKFVAILEADRINEQAANAFLKTLEEPPPQTLIVLITEQPSQLLPTILSRCIRLDLQEAPGIRLDKAQQAFLPACARAVAGLGNDVSAMALRSELTRFLAERRDDITRRLTQELREEARAIAQGTDTRDWEAQQKDATVALIETEYLAERSRILDLLSLSLGQAVLAASHAPDSTPLFPEIREAAASHSVTELLARLGAVDALRKDLEYNVHEGLALDNRLLRAFGA